MRITHMCRWRRRELPAALASALATAAVLVASAASAQVTRPKIAVAVSVTGDASAYAAPALDGARLALEEANASGVGPPLELAVYDDKSSAEQARDNARTIIASDALAVIGPATTAMSLAAGPIYAEAGLVSIGTTATGDGVTVNATTFRASFSTSDGGEALADYLAHVLHGRRAIVAYRDDNYGRPVAEGFRRGADRLGIGAEYRAFATQADIEQIVRSAADAPEQPALILAALEQDAAALIVAARRLGVKSHMLGTGAIAGEFFVRRFSNEPEERAKPGYFTDGVFAALSELLDSANAETLAFADRFRARFNQSPDFYAVQGYEAMRLAVAAVHATATPALRTTSLRAKREAVHAYLVSRNSPSSGVPGLNGPLWFTPERGRVQPLRMGRFHGTDFESAPTQLVPVSNPDPHEVATGALVQVSSDQFARRQQVVYTGIYLIEVPRLDIPGSTFAVNFYLWMRFARNAGDASFSPTDIEFPDLVRGSFEPTRNAVQRELADGTTYRLWQVRGDIKNDFDLRAYPFDRQKLAIRLLHANAASDRYVYVRDHRSIDVSNQPAPLMAGDNLRRAPSLPDVFVNTSPLAFRNLSQWEPLRTSQGRDTIVTRSALGDPRPASAERIRELSGFNFTIEIKRRVLSTLGKTLLPLALMALILFTSLAFPSSMVTPKITVVITSALAGTVLLSSINTQLGGIGYIIYVEYAFYAFFLLCVVCIISAILVERHRLAGDTAAAAKAMQISRYIYVLVLLATALAAWGVYARS